MLHNKTIRKAKSVSRRRLKKLKTNKISFRLSFISDYLVFRIMKQISTNELQDQISKVIREVETGEVYQVNRYSKSVAYLVSKKEFEKLISGSECKACLSDLRAIAQEIQKPKLKTQINIKK